jgi:hypothetical protein
MLLSADRVCAIGVVRFPVVPEPVPDRFVESLYRKR